MAAALAIANIILSALPTLTSLFEQILGAAHPDVVAAHAAVTTLQAAHASAVAAAPQS